jgi:ABC-type transport system involved in multi-copper enzyme maturation permease subunit
VKATTHAELYRPFRGQLRRSPRTALVLARSGIRTAYRAKWPLLLFAVPAIQMIVRCFLVYFAFSLKDSDLTGDMGVGAQLAGAALMEAYGDVEQQIVALLNITQFFTMIVLAWYGAGLIAEDRRLKAHLLYFARPVSQTGYILGKLLVVGFYGALAIVLPATVVVVVAVFSSPDWAFLQERGGRILLVELYALLWVMIHALGILAISSLTKRKIYALVAAVGFFILTNAIAGFLSEALDDSRWLMFSMFGNFGALAGEWLGVRDDDFTWPVEHTYLVLAGVALTFLVILYRQVGKMEREA